MNTTLADIAAIIHGTVIGDPLIRIKALSPINDVQPDTLIFAEGDDNLSKAAASSAAAVIVSRTITQYSKPCIQVANPFQAFMQLISLFYPTIPAPLGIHPTAVIGPDVTLGNGISIGPYVVIQSGSCIGDHSVIKGHVYIGHHVKIGSHCVLHPHVTLYDQTVLHDHVIIHASSVIGSDGFGYQFNNGQHQKIPHAGHVVLHDHVEIGANSVVDRATLGTTDVGKGTKIDNFVQIAHSVKLGQHNILCAFTGIAGSTTSGNHVVFAANVGVSDHVTIEDEVILGARAGVPPNKTLRSGNIYLGNPARPKDKAIEQELSVTRIPFIRKNIKELTQKLNQLFSRIDALEKE